MRTNATYSDELVDLICERIANGGSLSKICKEAGMPCRATFTSWVRDRANVKAMYAEALDLRAELFFEEVHDLADDAVNGTILDEEGNYKIDPGSVSVAKLRVESRKWMLTKMQPGKYGDRVIHAGDDSAPVVAKMISGAEGLLALLGAKRDEP